jgi:hypothetical protein
MVRKLLVGCGLVCPKTGRFRPASRLRGAAVLLLPLVGLLSLIWFLVRVIPKPSRASYPCMRAAAPLASGFIVWLVPGITLVLSGLKRGFTRRLWILGVVLFMAGSGSLAVTLGASAATFPNAVVEGAAPMGTAQGIHPGRVVWVWDPAATNENLTNRPGDGWFLPANNDQAAIDRMLSEGLRSLTGRPTDAEAWSAIFTFHNKARRGSPSGYRRGEKIFIKINAVSAWWGNFDPKDDSILPNQYYGNAETSPEVVLSVLRQLVRTVGVSQQDIWLGDPISRLYKHSYDLLHAEFPNVHYLDHDAGASLGREKSKYTASPAIFYSDRGTIMRAGTNEDSSIGPPTESDTLCTMFQTAEYVINIPALKGHKRAGVSMFAKNNFGSQGRGAASHLHGGLVNPTEKDPYRQGYGLYRVQVDLMGHEWTGGKILVFIMDALYAGPEAVDPPTKWRLAPFNGDWTSSLFLSLDPVAIESVGYDFLRSEYTRDTPYSWVQMRGVDDYLHQAADPANWPKGIVYDPEKDGTPIGSLGVHEHWNNSTDKQYSRNLGTGSGIELVRAGAGFKGDR